MLVDPAWNPVLIDERRGDGGVWGAQAAGPPQDRFAVANQSYLAARQALCYTVKMHPS